jgi:hypothetical protein
MKKMFSLIMALTMVLAIGFTVQAATSLTGTWSCSEGGTYYITQIDDRVYWYGERSTTNPSWANIGVGKIVGNYIVIEATDVPKGTAAAQSDLILYRSTDNYFYASTKDGPFGGSNWTRK